MANRIVLSNGYEIPNFCYGSAIVNTYSYGPYNKKTIAKYWIKNSLFNKKQFQKDVALPKVIRTAMENGCTMFDTSRAYAGSEKVIGRELSKYERDSFRIVTKLSNTDQYKRNVREALEMSLQQLGLEYIDIYLMHWPVSEHYIDSWKQMEALYEEGLCKAIGVCNCNIKHLEILKNNSSILPMINQFECHPLFTQQELRAYCKANDIKVMAYTSTARMDERLRKTVLVPLSKKYNKSLAQIILRWHQQVGNIPIVNSSNKAHLLENINIKDFELTKEEIEEIEKININSRLRYDPENCDFRQL